VLTFSAKEIKKMARSVRITRSTHTFAFVEGDTVKTTTFSMEGEVALVIVDAPNFATDVQLTVKITDPGSYEMFEVEAAKNNVTKFPDNFPLSGLNTITVTLDAALGSSDSGTVTVCIYARSTM
jgi:hypothetical protein